MINPDYSIRPLVLAVIEHAILEACKGNAEARRWLYADGVLWLEGITDIHPEKIRAALDRKLGRHKPRKVPARTRQAVKIETAARVPA